MTIMYTKNSMSNDPNANHARFLQPKPELKAWLRTAALHGDCRSIHGVVVTPSKEEVIRSIDDLLLAAGKSYKQTTTK